MSVRYILYNPEACSGCGKEKAEELKNVLPGEKLVFLDIRTVSYPALFEEMRPEDHLILSGGDGTVNRFINDTCRLQRPENIEYFPGGSGNDFWRDLDGNQAAGPVPVGRWMKELPVVTVAGKDYQFLNAVGFGIDGYCCEVGDQQRARNKKSINYTGIAIKGLLFHFRRVGATVWVDGQSRHFDRAWMAPTMYGRYYGGGMMPAPAQRRDRADGKLSLAVVHSGGRLRTLLMFPGIFSGTHIKHKDMVDVLEGHHIRVCFDRPCALQIDGETFLNVTEYEARSAACLGRTPEREAAAMAGCEN